MGTAIRFQGGNSPLDFFGCTRLKKILHGFSVPSYKFRLKLSPNFSWISVSLRISNVAAGFRACCPTKLSRLDM